MNKFLVICCTSFTFFISSTLIGQFAITYPVAAEDITVCNGQTLLRVRVQVNAVSSNNTVTIAFPVGVSLVGGSQVVISSSGITGINFASGTAQNPTFSLSPANITIGSFIEFTVLRNASCTSRVSALAGGVFKDAITVAGSAGSFTDNAPAINAYNVYYPSTALTSPAPMVGVLNTDFTVNIPVANGGGSGLDGCASILYFYTVNTVDGSQQISLAIGGTALIPSSTNGDTLFYTVSGTLLSPDGQLCNGEQVVFTQVVRYKGCSSNPRYGSGWGCGSTVGTWCQNNTGALNIVPATGLPLFTALTGAKVGFVDMCTPWDFTLTYTNGGSGNATAAGMYNILSTIGYYPTPIIYGMDQSTHNYYNFRINGNSVPHTYVAGLVRVNLNNILTSDPDGAGGISDLDGDGFFDDLAGGTSFTLTGTTSLDCNKPCGFSTYLYYQSSFLSYNTMCGGAVVNADGIGTYLNTLFEYDFQGTAYAPSNITSGIPFNLNLSGTNYFNANDIETSQTRYVWKLILPSGVSVAATPNATYNGAAIGYTFSADTLIITSPTNSFSNANINLIYSCGSPGNLVLQYFLEKINSNTCKCMSRKICATLTLNAICPGSCPVGPETFVPTIRRANGSLGYTNNSLATRQNVASITSYDLSKALYRDTIEIRGASKSYAIRNNLHAELTLPKMTATTPTQSKLTPVNVTVRVIRGGALINNITLTSFSQAASTSGMQSIDWDLSAALVGNLQVGDSVFTISRYVVAINQGLPRNDIQSADKWKFFTLQGGVREICSQFIPEMYLVGTDMINGTNGHFSSGCTPVALGGGSNYIARRFSTSGTLFQNEYRPVMLIDSIVYDIPAGYDFVSSNVNGIPITANYIYGNGRKFGFINPGTWGNVGLTVTNNYGSVIPVVVKPTCATQPVENINYKIYVQDYYYSYVGSPAPANLKYPVNSFYGTIPSVDVPNTAMNGLSSGISYSTASKPDIVLSNLTGIVVADATNETVDFRISSVGTTTAPYVWFAIPTVTGSIVNQVTNLVTATVMTPIPYPGGNWYQFSTTGLASGTFNDFRIRFTYNNCNKDSIKLIGGWNCSLYPVSPNAYACFKDSIYLKYQSANAEVQVTPLVTPAMPVNACTPLNYEYTVLSAGQGNITNVRFYLQVPTGLTISTPLQAEYPIGSGNWTTLPPITAGSFRIYNLFAHPFYPTATGLPGTNNSLLTAPRQFRVRFAFTTNCNFVSGSNFSIAGFGRKTCGAVASGSNSPFQSPPIVLNGATVNFVMSHTLSSSPVACGGTSAITATSTVVGSSSGVGSYLTYLVPEGLNYLNGSLSCSSGVNCPTFVSKVFNADGTELITFNIPDNVSSGVTMNYTFNLQDSVAQNCTANPSVLRSFANASNVPCATVVGGICASVAVQTGQTSHVPVVSAGNLSIVTTTFNNNPSNPNYYIVGTQLLNSGQGSYTSGGGVTLSYYCADVLGNATGSPLFTYNVNQTIAPGAIGLSGSSFFAPPCAVNQNFIAIMSSTGTCHCAVDTARNLTVVIGPLPIELTQFQVERVNRLDAQVDWNTASESKTSHYAIFRSIDGVYYQEMGQKLAVGNSTNDISYSYLDKNVPQSKLYYKLIQYDLDGNSKAYGPVLLKGTDDFDNLTIYPNPTTGEIFFSQTLKGETVKIFDITGRIIFNQTVEGNFLKLLDFEPGTYQVWIMDEYNKSKMLPIVLMK